MADVYLDPYMWALPEAEATAQAFEKFVEDLIASDSLSRLAGFRLYKTAATDEALLDTDRYPVWGVMQTRACGLGLEHIDVQSVSYIVGRLLSIPTIEDIVLINAADVHVERVTLSPEVDLAGRPSLFRDQYQRLLMLICLVADLKNSGQRDHFLVTRGLAGSPVQTLVAGDIMCGFTDRSKPLLSCTISGRITTCAGANDLLRTVNPVTLWCDAQDEDEYRTAIRCFIFQEDHSRGDWNEAASNRAWSFGTDFLSTADRYGFLHDPKKGTKLLRKCADTITHQRLQDAHDLRSGQAGNNPQRKRGNDGAWRRKIDDEYRLHYWETQEGPELASVGPHNYYDIPG